MGAPQSFSVLSSGAGGQGALSGGPYGPLWVPMGLYVSLWVSIVFLWVSVVSLWVSMGLYVSLWGPYGSLWSLYGFPMGLYGSL